MTTRCRHLPLVLVAITGALSIPSLCAASTEETNSLKGGATSIQFLTFGGGFRSPFRTSGLYFKHHLTDRSALRIGADFSLDESSGKAPSGTSTGGVENTRDYSFSLAGEYVRYFDVASPVSVFIGIGPYWTRGRGFFERTQTTPVSSTAVATDYFRNESRYWEIGASASAGFEWFFRRKLSVLGRLGASVGFGERHQGTKSLYSNGSGVVYNDSRHDDSTTASGGSSSAALGLSAYF